MTTFTLSDLFKSSTRDQMMTELLSIAASAGLPTTSWQAGAVVRTILVTVAQKLADSTLTVIEIAKGGFGDFVSDTQAPLWAKQTFDVDAIAAEAATGLVDLTNTSGTQYDLDAGDLIVAHDVTGKTYRNQAFISVLAGVGIADVAVQADEVGTGSDAAPGSITVLVSTLPGVGVTNPAAVLGADAETTAALVTRSRAKLGSLSPLGVKDAYNYVATTPFFPDGTPLSDTSTPITRTKTVASSVTGLVTVYLATASGAPTAPDVAIVQTSIDNWAEPWTATATAVAAAENTIAITYQVWLRNSNLTVAEISAAIGAALAEFFKTAPLGGFVIPPAAGKIYVQELEQVIGRATPGIVLVAVTVPAADVGLTANQVPKLGALTPTVTIL